ncbi:MAG: aminopeptidase [Acidobacteriota bacterium]
MDPRYRTLAEQLIGYSCTVQPGETVFIEAVDCPQAFTRALIRATADHGAHPLVSLKSQAILRDLMMVATEEQMRALGEVEAARMRKVQAYIGIRGARNISEWSDVPAANMRLYESLYRKPVHLDLRVRNTRWCVLRWPTASMAQQAAMSTEQFEDFYFDVCTLDYARMSAAMQPLRERMNATDRVRLIAADTDLTFSIRDIPAVPCDGHHNIPDGEVFTAPVRDSIEGTIQFNTRTIYQGVTHDNVRLRFEKGRIVEATSSQTEHLRRVLASDEGASYTGEFAIGFNPHITQPMCDILFDEKMAGSIHLTPGNAYEEADNGNRSEIHWDMVLRQTPEVGGGELWFDDVLVRKDGRFVLPELEALNPESLIRDA